MAFLLATSEFEPCECCGSVDHAMKQGTRTHYRYCYHSVFVSDRIAAKPSVKEQLLASAQPTHRVLGYSAGAGWGKRWGRLPICPEHKHDTDEDWDGI